MSEPFVPQISAGAAKALIIISFLFFAAAVCVLCFRRKKNRGKPFEVRGVVFLLLLLIATLFSRLVVGLSGVFAYNNLSVPEESVDSLVHAMQSFTLDEQYTDYLVKGKEVFSILFSERAATMYAIYVSVINVSCAVSGGAVLFTIVVKLFPRLRLFFASLCFWKPVCCFSELNAESLAFAKSIRTSDGNLKNALLIFCKADPKGGSSSGQGEQARQLGALLTRTGINDLRLHRIGMGKTFVLTGSDEDNLSVLSGFADDASTIRFGANDAIYMFTEGGCGTLVEKNVRDRINRRLNGIADERRIEDPDKLNKRITLFVVNRYRSSVYHLLMNKPLYTALSDGSKELRLAIFGSGRVGTEAFLGAYWCGQMFGRKLKITVVSAEKEEHFINRINHINSEILRTSEQYTDKELLKVYGDENEPLNSYFSFEYVQSNVYLDGLETLLTAQREGSPNGVLADFDYFIVTLGSDKKNLEVSEHIGRIVTVRRAVTGNDAPVAVPVACAIWSDALSESLRSTANTGFGGAEIVPFGSMESTFSIDRILFKSVRDRAANAKNLYEQKIAEKIDEKRKFEEDPYSYWANVTRAIHASYKAEYLKLRDLNDESESRISCYLRMSELISRIVSVRDLIEKAIQRPMTEGGRKRLQEKLQALMDAGVPEVVMTDGPDSGNLIEFMTKKRERCIKAAKDFLKGKCTAAAAVETIDEQSIPPCFHKLAWLEHRRWNAFMRAEGFRCPSEAEEAAYIGALKTPGPAGSTCMIDNTGKHKSIALKLHPCLVECDDCGIKPDLFHEQSVPVGRIDMLDKVSRRFKYEKYTDKQLHTYDFKKYDYVDYE